ncbi:hypothetical protein CB1_000547021 [Camelus ferus]|nr:hypothetical protein CB1_000547021 [Camelus ferus]
MLPPALSPMTAEAPGSAAPGLGQRGSVEAVTQQAQEDLVHFDVPSIHVELGSTLHLSPLEHVRRHSAAEKRDSEEESESTAL